MKNITIVMVSFFSLLSFGQTKNELSVTEKELKPVEIQTILDVDNSIDAVPVNNLQNDTLIYNSAAVEVQPEFPGGKEKMIIYISKNIVYSQQMKDNKLKGNVYASFVIEKDGSLSDIKINRDCGFGTGNEALKVLKKMPRWRPGIQNGKTVRCLHSIPIIIDATKQ